jgi:peptidoglycan/LPS O-acetylase OafA/YrhL
MDTPDTLGGASARLRNRLADRENSFDVLRLAAAAMVLVGHSFGLAGQRGSEPVLPLTDLRLSFAGLLLFFAISGFLVARSWAREPRLLPFAAKRGLRIMPGLLVALVLTAYLAGALTTTAGPFDYLTRGAPAEYVAAHSLMLTDRSVHERLASRVTEIPGNSLPGVFDSNPLPQVNGSLWTLPVEVTAYALLALGGLLLALLWRRRPSRIATAAVSIGAAAVFVGAGTYALRAGGAWVYPLFAVFAGGVLLHLLRDRLRLNVALFAMAVALWLASYQLPLPAQALLTGLTLPYAVVFLAFRGLDRLRWLTRPGDVSYGIYIYAWPVQQLVVDATGTRSPAVVIGLAGVATYVLALASWRGIERPALGLKRRLSRPKKARRRLVGPRAELAPAGTPGPAER